MSSREDRDVLDICWKPVKEDPQNFDAWTHLLQCIEQIDETKPAREAYDKFLDKFPYCYGYWKKYAELERRHKHYEKSIEVYERGVTAIALSVDLWMAYLEFYKEFVKDSEVRERRIRYLYERAISAAGLEFRSDKLWEDYINWEVEEKRLPEALGLYDRVLKVPTLLYSAQFDRIQELVNSHPPDRLLPEEEYNEYYKEVEHVMKEKGLEVYVVEEVPQEESGQNEEETDVKPPRTEYRKRYQDEALKLFRVAILDKRRKIHLYNEQEVSKRWNYEEGIKRPYFHVKPLERAQLKNWRNYLDFEIQEGIHERIVVLFERCLIACALYEDIWIRYARYMEKKESDLAREVYRRACRIHLPKKANPRLAWAAYEEKKGDFSEARDLLYEFEKHQPGLLNITFRMIGIERREAEFVHSRHSQHSENGGPSPSSKVSTPDYTGVSSKYEKLLRDPKTPPKVASFYAIKFAKFQAKIRRDKRLAEKILIDALQRDPDNTQVHLQLVDIAYSSDPMDQKEVIAALDRALKSSLPDNDKLRFSQRKLEFLEDLGNDISILQEHFEYHQKLYKSLGISSGKRKGGPSGDTPDKRSRNDESSHSVPQQAPQGYYTYQQPGYYQQQPQAGYAYGQYPVGQPVQQQPNQQPYYFPQTY